MGLKEDKGYRVTDCVRREDQAIETCYLKYARSRPQTHDVIWQKFCSQISDTVTHSAYEVHFRNMFIFLAGNVFFFVVFFIYFLLLVA